jgi:hypothetical protein
MSKIFPIKTETACQFKWSWSTIFLGSGTTTSCHRCHHWEFDIDTVSNFHNLPGKLLDREKMLEGLWPGNGCEYCKKVEDAGGASERQVWINDKDLVPPELETDLTAVNVTPRLLEVYFTNLCNQACVYCTPRFSSTIQHEFNKFGPISVNPSYHEFSQHADYDIFLKKFWEWMHEHSKHLYEFQVLGGEPLFQDEFDQCLDFFDSHPNPNLDWRIFTNLKHNTEKFKIKIKKIEKLIEEKKIKNFQFVCSIDSWGEQAEFVRYGMCLENWEDNFKILVDSKNIGIHVHMTVMPLTLVTMDGLLEKINFYRNQKPITISSNTITNPTCMDVYNFGDTLTIFLEKAINAVGNTDHDKLQKDCLIGMRDTMKNTQPNITEIRNFRNYLDEISKRRNADWKKLFPEIDNISSKLIQ